MTPMTLSRACSGSVVEYLKNSQKVGCFVRVAEMTWGVLSGMAEMGCFVPGGKTM